MKTYNDLTAKIDAGMKAAVAQAIEEHRLAGRSIVVSRDGKIVEIPPEEIVPLAQKTELQLKATN